MECRDADRGCGARGAEEGGEQRDGKEDHQGKEVLQSGTEGWWRFIGVDGSRGSPLGAATAKLVHADAGATAEIEDEAGALVKEAATTWRRRLSVMMVTLMNGGGHTKGACESAAAHAAAEELSEEVLWRNLFIPHASATASRGAV